MGTYNSFQQDQAANIRAAQTKVQKAYVFGAIGADELRVFFPDHAKPPSGAWSI
jgi:hypothetical protein